MKASANGNGMVLRQQQRLRLKPNSDHEPDTYHDLQLDFNPLLFTSLERYLPNSLLTLSRDSKIHFMRDILTRYSPQSERLRIQKHREYRQRIISMYPPRNRGIYSMRPLSFFLPSFLKAVKDNTEESFRSIMTEPVPGVYTFDMLQPSFCEMLMSEVENFERWVHDVKFRIMRPNTMNKYGAVLDDFGFENMLGEMMDDYIHPMSQIFFPEVGGLTLDSHHGFVVEYGTERDTELGFHVDDSEVTLNVCLGKQFYGGELFFRGVRCDKHVNTETQTEEILDYAHVPGRAILHRGRHRHGARPTFSGNRMNLILWCRSSVFREMKKYQKDCSSWCAECRLEKKERLRLSIAATKQELLKRDGPNSIGGARGIRITVTTRHETVAKITSQIAACKLQGLSEDDAWLLFSQIAFEGGKEPQSTRYKSIGKEIVAKCGGVPLALEVIGGLLYFKETEEWELFRSKEVVQIHPGENPTKSTLMLSYNHHSPQLKHCFHIVVCFLKISKSTHIN